MAEITLKTRICIRRDTKQNWESANPVLLDGEIGLETDTGLVKYGANQTPWNQLEYAIGSIQEAEISGLFTKQQ